MNDFGKKSFLQSAKMRLILTIIIGLAIVLSILFYLHHRRESQLQTSGSASVSSAPGIQSIPGAGNPSHEYVTQQNIQNESRDIEARKKATSNVPTITRSDFIGNPASFVKQAASPQCPVTPGTYKPNPENCTIANLQRAKEAGVTAEELVCQNCSCPNLRSVGYTAGDMKSAGYSAEQLRQCGYTLNQLMTAGFSVADLKKAGFDAAQLKAAGFTAGQLASAFPPNEIAQAGYTPTELAAAGIQHDDLANCSVSALKKARAQGISAAQLRTRGCSVSALKAAGYTAKELKDAGFTAAELKAGGFDATQLKNAGFSANDLQAAGFTPAQLSDYCSVRNIKKLRAAGISALEIKNHGCDLAAMKAAGYTAAELAAAGFTPKQLKDAGFSLADLKAAGLSAAALKAAGFNAAELKKAGFSAQELKNAGFSAADLKNAGFSATDLKNAGFNAADLKNAGFSAGQLKNAGFSAQDLKDAGFTPTELHMAGFSAKDLKEAGFSAAELHLASYSKGDLIRAGFTPQQAGYIAPAIPQTATQQIVTPPAVSGNTTLPSITESTPEGKLAAIQRLEQQQMNAQQRADAMQQMQGTMTLQAQKLLAGWSTSTKQTYVLAPPTDKNSNGENGNGTNGSKLTGPIIKAGTVMFAVLDTAINSDERSPILAHIVMGPLQGSKLLGRFSRVHKKLLISFNLLNAPNYAKSLTVNAVAIDPDTARTALAGEVNSHYLLRYGTLFASAFLQGLSTAVLQSGTTQNCFFGICSTTHTPLDFGEQVEVGLGTVGQQYANVMGKNFNRPPTIKIPGGTGIGVLFMSDLALPANPTIETETTVPSPIENNSLPITGIDNN